MTMEKPFINYIFTDLRGEDFKGPNCWFVSPRGVSRDPGMDVIPERKSGVVTAPESKAIEEWNAADLGHFDLHLEKSYLRR